MHILQNATYFVLIVKTTFIVRLEELQHTADSKITSSVDLVLLISETVNLWIGKTLHRTLYISDHQLT